MLGPIERTRGAESRRERQANLSRSVPGHPRSRQTPSVPSRVVVRRLVTPDGAWLHHRVLLAELHERLQFPAFTGRHRVGVGCGGRGRGYRESTYLN